jgi:lipopolysaccharide assembly outer membrane protein LptD (OstA)
MIIIFSALFFSLFSYAIVNPIPFKPKAAQGSVEKKKEGGEGEKKLEKGKYILTFDEVETISEDVYKASGNVRYESEDMLLTCDTLIYDKNKNTIHAEGNVAVDFNDFTISGNMLDYDTKEKTGTVYDAMGMEKSGDYTVIAKVIRKTGEDWYEVEDAIFTSCNSALPPWSLKISKGKFHINHYAYLNNPRFKVRNFPIVYSPYLIWPIKPDRSTGFLLPTIGSSNTKGLSIGTAFYYAPQDFWDTTIYYDYYEKAGNGLGLEFRYALTERNYGYLSGYYIADKLMDKNRWYLSTTNIGRMGDNWNYLLDVNLISDGDFFRDYERDYSRGTKGNFDSTLFMTKKLYDGSLNFILERGVEYYSSEDKVTQKALPKIEFRLPPTRLKWGMYLALETSFSEISRELYDKSDQSYYRVDFHPTIEAPLYTPPYIDIIPSLEIRETYYSEGSENKEDSMLRRQIVAGINLEGPRFFKKFKDSSKHIIEPFFEAKVESSKDKEGYPLYDDIDVLNNLGDNIKYGVRNRFYDKDGRLTTEVEIAQSKNFDYPVSFSEDKTSKFSPLVFSFRYWPKKLFSFDFRLSYHPITNRFEDRVASISFSTPNKEQFFRFSYYYSNNPAVDNTSFRAKYEELLINASLRIFDGRCTFQPHLERDLVDDKWRNARIVFWYHGSCFNIGFEAGRREIGYFRDTSFRILVSLKQVGTVVDLFGGSEEMKY